MSAFFKLVGIVTFGGFVFACAGSDKVVTIGKDGGVEPPAVTADGTQPADLDSFCSSICARETTCDSTLDDKTCQNTCHNGYAASFSKLRSDYVEKVEACVDATSCKTLEIGTCVSDSIAELAPTDAAVSFCDAVSASKCSLGQTKAQCLNSYKQFDDSALADAQACTTKACTQVPSCIAAVFGSGTSNPAPVKTTCSTSTYSDLPNSCSTCAANSCCTEATACAADSQCRALMSVCTVGSPNASSCNAALGAVSTTTRNLLGSYFTCANSCTGNCYSNANL